LKRNNLRHELKKYMLKLNGMVVAINNVQIVCYLGSS
jgi:hypothetical protein